MTENTDIGEFTTEALEAWLKSARAEVKDPAADPAGRYSSELDIPEVERELGRRKTDRNPNL